VLLNDRLKKIYSLNMTWQKNAVKLS